MKKTKWLFALLCAMSIMILGCKGIQDDDDDEVTVDGSVYTNGSTTVNGTVDTNGTTTVNGTVYTNGTTTVDGTVTTNGTTTVDGTVTTNGTTTVDGTVTTDSTVSGTVTVTQDSTIYTYLYHASGLYKETVYDSGYYTTDTDYTTDYPSAINDSSHSSYDYGYYKHYYSTYKENTYDVSSALVTKTTYTNNSNYTKYEVTVYGYKYQVDTKHSDDTTSTEYLNSNDREYKALITYTIYKLESGSCYYGASLETAPDPDSDTFSIEKLPSNTTVVSTKIEDTGITHEGDEYYTDINYYKTTTGTSYSDLSFYLYKM